uniref:F-box domain-containing protein n=1 Tax=Pithovirus LCPAC401 TaxID=2506595 RepID=A0A481Z9D1_9VIRU|nr:MAG: uncharacterized protein LCPAC401_01320 [Pithovirus LCPAC401]
MNSLTSDLVQKIFFNLLAREIFILPPVSVKFNLVCKRESLWRDKVFSDYGIEKKYGEHIDKQDNLTWERTAKWMTRIRMINMNNKWINGQTYREILNESLEKGVDFLKCKKTYELIKFTNNPKYLYEFMNADSKKSVDDIAFRALGRELTQIELNNIHHIRSKEILAISGTVEILLRSYPALYGGDMISHNYDKHPELYSLPLVDPIYYVMKVCSFCLLYDY